MAESMHDLLNEDEKHLLFGWFGFTPSWLQGLNRPRWIVFFMFLGYTFQSLVANGLPGVILSTIEVRFGLSSTQSSWVAAVYDLAAVPVIVLISFMGTTGIHRPRWTAVGLILVFVGSILFALPHFTTDTYVPDSGNLDPFLCEANTTHSCDVTLDGIVVGAGSLQKYLIVFIAARILMGVGCEPMYTVGVTFLDDCVRKEEFSLYIAILLIGGVVGPAIAYVAGGYILTVFTEFYHVSSDRIGIEPSDPRWVGAWWVLAIVGALFVLVVAIPFTAYPYDIPGAADVRAQKVSEAHNAPIDEQTPARDMGVTLPQLPSYLKYFFTNPTFVLIIVYNTCDMMIVAGFTAFGPKYIETQFSISPAFSAMLFGILTIPGGVGGLLLGGWLIKRFNMACSAILKLSVLFNFLCLLTVFQFLLRCDPAPFAGINMQNTTLINSCNSGCGCESVPFTPICGADGIQYFSPCHAGCSSVEDTGSIKEYYNCTCMLEHTYIANHSRSDVPWLLDQPGVPIPWATGDTCSNGQCKALPVFLVLILLAIFFIFGSSGMTPSIIFRCVPSSHRTMGVGLQSILARILGAVSGPVLFGLAFDKACNYWDETCGDSSSTGSCLSYNNRSIANNLFYLLLTVKAVAFISMLLAWRSYKPPQDVNAKEMVSIDEIHPEITLQIGAHDVTKPPIGDSCGSDYDSTRPPQYDQCIHDFSTETKF